MNILKIQKIVENHQPTGSSVQRFAVLILLFLRDDELHILFELRSRNMRSQPGEICLPGGRLELGEKPFESALRETHEELGIHPSRIEIIGSTDVVCTPFHYELNPVIGYCPEPLDLNSLEINRDEVDSVFSVPLSWLLNHHADRYPVSTQFEFPEDFPFHKIQSGRDYRWKSAEYPIIFYEYEEHIIWGMTARVLDDFCKLIRESDTDTAHHSSAT